MAIFGNTLLIESVFNLSETIFGQLSDSVSFVAFVANVLSCQGFAHLKFGTVSEEFNHLHF